MGDKRKNKTMVQRRDLVAAICQKIGLSRTAPEADNFSKRELLHISAWIDRAVVCTSSAHAYDFVAPERKGRNGQ